MDNFETVNIDGKENVVGKNIIYKSRIIVNIYNENISRVSSSYLFLIFLLMGFVGSLISTEIYLNYIQKSDFHLIFIVLFCAFVGVISVIFLIKSHDINEKNNLCVLIGVVSVVGVLVLLVMMNNHLFSFERTVSGLRSIISLLIISFVNFILGVFLFYKVVKT